MTDGQTTTGNEGPGGSNRPPWYRPAKGTFGSVGGRPARPRAELPSPATKPATRMPRRLPRRGRKAGDVALRLKPDRKGPPPWKRTALKPDTGGSGRSAKRPRGRLTPREMVSRETGKRWIGPVSDEPGGPTTNPILALEAWLFPGTETSDVTWKRDAVPSPDAKRTPRNVRPKGELKGRPRPRKRRLPWHRVMRR